MIRRFLLGLVGVVGLSLPIASSAAPVTWYFGGTLNSVSDDHAGSAYAFDEFSIGDSFSGSFTFESTASDSNPSPNDGWYMPAPAMSVVVHGNYFWAAEGGVGDVSVHTDPTLNSIHAVVYSDYFSLDPTIHGSVFRGPLPPDAIYPQEWHVNMYDTTGTVFSNDALPLAPPTLESFTEATFGMWFRRIGLGGDLFIVGSLDYLSATAPIPEPETYAMLFAGLGLLGYVARRRKLKQVAAS